MQKKLLFVARPCRFRANPNDKPLINSLQMKIFGRSDNLQFNYVSRSNAIHKLELHTKMHKFHTTLSLSDEALEKSTPTQVSLTKIKKTKEE